MPERRDAPRCCSLFTDPAAARARRCCRSSPSGSASTPTSLRIALHQPRRPRRERRPRARARARRRPDPARPRGRASAITSAARRARSLIAADGTIASPVHAGADAITAACRRPSRRPDARDPPPRAVARRRPAPDVSLRTLEGAEGELSSTLSGRTAVLFWRPTCGFCERMLPDLLAVRGGPPPDDAPSLLLISTGDRRGRTGRWA